VPRQDAPAAAAARIAPAAGASSFGMGGTNAHALVGAAAGGMVAAAPLAHAWRRARHGHFHGQLCCVKEMMVVQAAILGPKYQHRTLFASSVPLKHRQPGPAGQALGGAGGVPHTPRGRRAPGARHGRAAWRPARAQRGRSARPPRRRSAAGAGRGAAGDGRRRRAAAGRWAAQYGGRAIITTSKQGVRVRPGPASGLAGVTLSVPHRCMPSTGALPQCVL